MKDSFYFPHDENAANTQDILKLRLKFGNLEGYAMFFMVLEAMSQQDQGILPPDCIAQLSFSYHIAIETLTSFISYAVDIGLIKRNEKGYFTPRMLKHKEFRKERSEAGKRGAVNRWKHSSAIGSAYAKERKEKEIKNPLTPLAKTLINWLSSMDDVKNPSALAKGYMGKYGEGVIRKALKNSSCTSRSEFSNLCEHYAKL